MTANVFYNGVAEDVLEFDRPINYLNISVETGVTFSFSLDSVNYIPLPVGFHSFYIGPVSTLYISSNGAWHLMGVQA